ncbi:MAG: hypothetical protein AAGJ87_14550 [Pseudomonadota bacterium]
MIRVLLAAATAVAGAAAAGRKLADRTLDARIAAEIETAKMQALCALDRETGVFMRDRLGGFARTLLVKAALMAIVFLAFASGAINAQTFRIGAASLLAAFLGYDLVRGAPRLRDAARLLRAYGVNGKKALRDYVAAAAFERAYVESRNRLDAGAARRLVQASTYTADDLSKRIATAVAEIAGAASYDRVKAHAGVAALKAAILGCAYAGFLFLVTTAS